VPLAIQLPAAKNMPVKTGNLTIGTDCDSLILSSGFTQLTVTGDLTISTGKTFSVDPAGTPHIYVGGNWIAKGTFSPGQSTVIMNSGTNATINIQRGAATIFYDDFEGPASNWTLSGEFEISAPAGLGGSYGYADPDSAYTGLYVLGVDLMGAGNYPGDYEKNLGDRRDG